MNHNKPFALCTLFNSMYLDKGIVLYQSLEKVSTSFRLYVLAMDDKCYDILSDLAFDYLVPIRLSDFENEDLLEVKANRSFGEYCFTCSSSLIKYILDTYEPDYCAYIDADMKFYGDPITIIEELEEKNASVSIVGHRFGWYAKKSADIIGTFCVECNVFKNDEKARKLLGVWIGQCMEDCSKKNDGIHYGDQKYLDNWVIDYNFVIETDNLGAGIAPWNIPQYKLVEANDEVIKVKCRDKVYNTLFYHFEGITYESPTEADIHIYSRWGIDDKLVGIYYKPYLKEIYAANRMIREKYGIEIIIKHHPAIQQKGRVEIIAQKIKYVLSCGIIGLLFHVIPRALYQKKDKMSIEF